MNDLNSVLIEGNLTRDPELRYIAERYGRRNPHRREQPLLEAG